MGSESTSTLVLRSPVQGRPAIAWAAVLSQGARGLELAVTFLDSTVGGIALRLLDGTGLLDASHGVVGWGWGGVVAGVVGLIVACGCDGLPRVGPRWSGLSWGPEGFFLQCCGAGMGRGRVPMGLIGPAGA